ncbi:unnamed protein product [Rotaria sp. Silwood2]|nr:unnamed protein product [Rotaria sp. Silwood2]CAF3886498.1 unnamed protein product [Rotaria sp. Silwood2]
MQQHCEPSDPNQQLLKQHHQLQQLQHLNVTAAATRYAQTRLPFPPYIIRFKSGYVKEKQAAEEIVTHFKSNFQLDILFMNYRISTTKCTAGEYDILLFAKNMDSFTSLLDQNRWPSKIGNTSYSFPSSLPSIPPQLSLIIKNVDLRTSLKEFTDDIKELYPDIRNIIRLKNKFQQDIRMVKVELGSIQTRNNILKGGKICINYRTYDVDEYIGTASVLICSKCCGIGHFKSRCSQSNETCRNCGNSYPDLKLHKCTNEPCCIHCNGKHASNNNSCPVIKQFRSDLTKKLLTTNHGTLTSSTSVNKPSNCDLVNFPQLNPALNSSIPGSNSNLNTKLDQLILNMAQLNENMIKITEWNSKFEKFMNDKTIGDQIVQQDINRIMNNTKNMETNLVQHDLKLKRHENIFVKLLIPFLQDISQFIISLNKDRQGRILDPDLKLKFEIHYAQLEKTVIDNN